MSIINTIIEFFTITLTNLISNWWNELGVNGQLQIILGIMCAVCIIFIIKHIFKYIIIMCFISLIFYFITIYLVPSFWNDVIPTWDTFSLLKRLIIILIFGLSFTSVYYFSKFYKYVEHKAYSLKNANLEESNTQNIAELSEEEKCTQNHGKWNENKQKCHINKTQLFMKHILD